MFEFLKKLFYNEEEELTVVLLDDDHPEGAESYTCKPEKLRRLFYGAGAALVIVTLLLLMFTPLGAMLYNQEDSELRQQVIEVSQRVEALQDSLRARDMQLNDIQKVLTSGADTTFRVETVEVPGTLASTGGSRPEDEQSSGDPLPGLGAGASEVPVYEMVSQSEIIFSELFSGAPRFPAQLPVQGTMTRNYNPDNRHYGIDIATSEGTELRALADGSVVSRDWSVNYGYVIHIQHGGGILSVYKHVTQVSKEVGDVVLQGDILGTVGDAGVLSSGPHLHLEIWKDGVPQNPSSYLINP